jgi:hypothetical protein
MKFSATLFSLLSLAATMIIASPMPYDSEHGLALREYVDELVAREYHASDHLAARDSEEYEELFARVRLIASSLYSLTLTFTSTDPSQE